MIKFSDGMSFDTSGPLRVEHRIDGWYVVGEGMLCPMNDREDCENFIEEWNDKVKRRLTHKMKGQISS